MGRLIDANKLIDYFYYGENDKPIIDVVADRKIIDIIKNQPTAYDVEKVVEGLENMHSYYVPIINSYCNTTISKAIEIVRKGGVEHE